MRNLYTDDFTLYPRGKVALIQSFKLRCLILDSLGYPVWTAPEGRRSCACPVSTTRGDLRYSRASQMPADC